MARWRIGFLLFIGVAINYLDRVNISHAIINISKYYLLSEIEKGFILSAFSCGYVLFMMLGGYLVFKYGARTVLFVSALLLSITTIAAGLTTGFYSLLVSRFLIGAFEAPLFPASAYIVSRWFPKTERAKATSLFDAGSYVGSALAAPAIVYVIIHYSWQSCFLFSGLLGLVWSVLWLRYFRDNPNQQQQISNETTLALEADLPVNKPAGRFSMYLKDKRVIGASAGFFCYNYLKSFHLTWFPTYLVEAKGASFAKLGLLGFIPPSCAIIGELVTGYGLDKLVGRGFSATYVKKASVCLGLLLSSIIIGAVFVESISATIAFITLSYVFLIASSVGIWSIPDELTDDKRSIAIIGSIQNTFSNVAGIIAPIVTGYLYYHTHSFVLPFLICFCVSLLGASLYWFTVGEFGGRKTKLTSDRSDG
jgi:MFS transporter, ACS family, D-galactonate transporter